MELNRILTASLGVGLIEANLITSKLSDEKQKRIIKAYTDNASPDVIREIIDGPEVKPQKTK